MSKMKTPQGKKKSFVTDSSVPDNRKERTIEPFSDKTLLSESAYSDLGYSTMSGSTCSEISRSTCSALDSGVLDCETGLVDNFQKVSLEDEHKESEIFDSGCGLSTSENISEVQTPQNLVPSIEFIFRPDTDGDTLLHLAVVKQKADAVLNFIRLAPFSDLLDMENDLFQTPLHLAVLVGNSDIARMLVVAGATVDRGDHRGRTPLHLASRHGHLDCVRAILDKVSNKEIEFLCLQYKVFSGPSQASCLADQRNFDGETALHLAVRGGHKEVIEELVWHYGADINAKEGKCGKTPLHQACEQQEVDLVEFLLQTCKADVNSVNYADHTPLHLVWTLYRYDQCNERLLKIILLLRVHHGEPQVDPGSDVSDTESEDSEEGIPL